MRMSREGGHYNQAAVLQSPLGIVYSGRHWRRNPEGRRLGYWNILAFCCQAYFFKMDRPRVSPHH
jgi:hypothetical protein